VDCGQHGPDIDLADHPDDTQERARAYRRALESAEQPACLGRAGPAGEEPLDGRALTPAVRGDLLQGPEHLIRPFPHGADCYLLANVLHDWDDSQAIDILRNCRRSMARGGRVLIIERLIPDVPGDAVPTLLSDINMLVITGGQERTNAEYAHLLARAGLRIGTVHPVAFPYGIIEGLSA
jgi:hypothetical protein